MARNLPPLNSLRAFEAAARRLSFTRAAEELGVTQGAISHHVKVLEEAFGTRLFRRINNRLALTEKGGTYLVSVRQAFRLLYEGTEALHSPGRYEVLTLSVLPHFALRWLVPRLAGFHDQNTGIDVHLLTSYRGTDFLREDIDAAIRLGADWPVLHADYLFGSDMFPVCSPALLAQAPLDAPLNLGRHRLLHVFGALEDWPLWLAAAGVSELAADRGPTFDSYALAIDAAIHGCGVAMARGAFVQDELANHRLVAPFDLRLSRDESWHFLWPRTEPPRKLLLFRSWLLAEAAATQAMIRHSAPA